MKFVNMFPARHLIMWCNLMIVNVLFVVYCACKILICCPFLMILLYVLHIFRDLCMQLNCVIRYIECREKI